MFKLAIAALTALPSCGAIFHSPSGEVCVRIGTAQFAPGLVDFTRPSPDAQVGTWTLLSSGQVFGFSVAEDAPIWSTATCAVNLT